MGAVYLYKYFDQTDKQSDSKASYFEQMRIYKRAIFQLINQNQCSQVMRCSTGFCFGAIARLSLYIIQGLLRVGLLAFRIFLKLLGSTSAFSLPLKEDLPWK